MPTRSERPNAWAEQLPPRRWHIHLEEGIAAWHAIEWLPLVHVLIRLRREDNFAYKIAGGIGNVVRAEEEVSDGAAPRVEAFCWRVAYAPEIGRASCRKR